MTAGFDVPGYEALADTLRRAYNRTAHGKGVERHGDDRVFTDQSSMTIARLLDGEEGPLFQAMKKIRESLHVPRDRAVLELLDAINYVAMGVLLIEEIDERERNACGIAHEPSPNAERVDLTYGEHEARVLGRPSASELREERWDGVEEVAPFRRRTQVEACRATFASSWGLATTCSMTAGHETSAHRVSTLQWLHDRGLPICGVVVVTKTTIAECALIEGHVGPHATREVTG